MTNVLKQDNALRERLRTLAERGVVLAARRTTLQRRHLAQDDLLPFAITVDSGIAEIVRRQTGGWAYLKGRYVISVASALNALAAAGAP